MIESGADAMRAIEASSWNQQSFVMPFVWLAMLLFFIDITIRRFGLPSWRRLKQRLERSEVAVDPAGATSITSVLEKTRNKRES